jgi:hypothetical protein
MQQITAQDTLRVKKVIAIYCKVGLTVTDNTAWLAKNAGEAQTLTSPSFGLSLHVNKISSTFSLLTDFYVEPTLELLDSNSLRILSPINTTWLQHQFMVYHNFRSFSIGAGTFWRRRENVSNHVDPGFFYWKTSGLNMAVSVPINWLTLEYQTKVTLKPLFDATGRDSHSLLLLYNFNKEKNSQNNRKRLAVSALIGARFFSTSNVDLIPGEDITPIGTAPAIGLEFLHKKSGLLLSFERDWWLSLNGGSLIRDTKGYVNSSFISFGYQKKLKNGRAFRTKLGWSAIVDHNSLKDITINTPHYNKLLTYQVKGIGVACSYELIPKTDLEIKHTLPILGDKLFNPLRFSVGLIHRYNPSE